MSQNVQKDWTWWIKEAAQHNERSLCITQWDVTIETYASTKGWDALCQEMTTGRSVSYQLFGALCGFSNIEVLSEGQEENRCAAEDGQCMHALSTLIHSYDIDCLHQRDGRHSLHCLSDPPLGMVLEREITIQAEHLRTWRTQCVGRLGVSPSHQFQRLDAPESFLQWEMVWGPFSIALFPSQTNAQLPDCCS